jgi:acid phosphatase
LLIAALAAPLFMVGTVQEAHAGPIAAAPRAAANALVPAFDHIFVVIMENTSASSIIGNTSQAPYINSLAKQYAYSSNYFAITHPSLPNYLTLTGASSFGITSDCLPSACPVNAANIGDRLDTAGTSWKAYMESMPAACRTTDSSPYVAKHNPFVYFNNIRTDATRCNSHVLPLTQLATDLKSASTTPRFGWITPNMCNDMHDCSISTGDTWLSNQVPAILNSAAFTTQNSALFLLWDEDDFTGTNQVELVVAGSQVKKGYISNTQYNHYSLMRTIEDAWNMAPLTSNDTAASPMTDFFGVNVAGLCAATSLAGTPATAPPDSIVAMNATSSVCATPKYQFWVQQSGGAWKLAQGWGGSSFNWSNAGLTPGPHQLGVWARQSGSTTSYDAYGITTSTISVDNCVSAGLATSLAPPQVRGTKVTFTGSATSCGSPQYRFWLKSPGAAWKAVQAYGTTASWLLDSALYPSGNYQVGVWARQAGSAKPYDSFHIRTYWISPAAGCNVSALNAGATPPQAVGSSVTFTPQQAGCTGQYRFWLLPPGGAWKSVQSYGVGTTWSWNTAGYAPGTYQVGVWEGSASSPSTYKSSAITSFAVGVATCTSTARTSSLVPPQVSGVSVAFTPTSTRCSAPQYEFWLMAPGGAWILKQGYGSGGWTWTTAGLAPGTYQVGVWARQSGSTASYDAYFISTYQLSA